MRFGWQWLFVAMFAVAGACDVKERGTLDGGGGGFIDASFPDLPDANQRYFDADIVIDGDGGTCAPAICSHPVDDGCRLEETCNDGLDNNCNGVIDENCTCAAGAVQSCFLGPPGRAEVGACQRGTQTCEGDTEFGHWGPCTGGIFPSGDVCDGLDNNCNGCADDNPACCDVLTKCPDQSSLPEAHPFTDYMIDGANYFPLSSVVKWSWTVEGGPCDVLLKPDQSFTLNTMSTSTLSGPSVHLVTFRPTLSGDYTVTVKVTHADGTTESCTFIVHVAGPGLRVELCWEKTGHADVDLHVHRPNNTTAPFGTLGTMHNQDDCYYANCKAGGNGVNGTSPDWGLANSPLAECAGTEAGADWQHLGYCRNPRLDADNISDKGKPENINIDTPRDGDHYRVAVHYFGQNNVITHPIVNVYCNGTRLGTYGQLPDQLQSFDNGASLPHGPIWRVVDVTTHVDAAGTTTSCDLKALTLPTDPTQPFVTCPAPETDTDTTSCSDLSY